MTQLQTIIQNQIKQFGDNLYKDGSKLQGGDIYLSDERWIETSKEDSLANKIIPGTILLSNNDDSIRATVLFRFENDESLFLFVKYENDNRFDETKNVSYYKNNDEEGVLLNLQSVISAGIGSFAAVSEGYYYVRGTAARVEDSVILISAKEQKTFEQFDAKTKHNPLSISIGFNILEKIYTEEDDEQLYDNSAGFLNKISKGAARLKLELELTQKNLDEIDDNFVEIIKFEDGVKEVENDRTIFNEINTQIAKRTFETSGNFLNDQFIVTAGDIYTDNNKRKIKINVDAGDGYVNGYRVETFGSKEFSVNPPELTDNREVNIRQYIGNYFKVEKLVGIPSTNEIITLRNTDISGNKVDIANAYYRYVRKSSAGHFEVYLYNIKTIESIFLATPLTSAADVAEGDVVIGKKSKARGIVNKVYATNLSRVDITDVKGSFIVEDITIVKSGGDRDANSITAISIRDLSEVREMTNGDGTFTADIILDDSHKLSGLFASHRSEADPNFFIVGGAASFFRTELRVGDRLSIVADNEEENVNISYRYFMDVGGIATDNIIQIRSSTGLVETTTYTPEDGTNPAKTETSSVVFDDGDFLLKKFSDITVQRAKLQEPSQTPLLAKLPNNRIETVSNVRHKFNRIYNCAVASGEATLSGGGNFDIADTRAVVFGNSQEPVEVDISETDTNTATISNKTITGSKIQLVETLPRVATVLRKKELMRASDKIVGNTNVVLATDSPATYYGKNFIDQEFLLEKKDILEITGVYDYDTTITNGTNDVESFYSGKPNKKDLFLLDNGQRDGFITFGSLERKANVLPLSKPVIIFYTYYDSTGDGNFTTADSYSNLNTSKKTDYNKIPFYKTNALTDSVDFRLTADADNAATLNTTKLTFGDTGCPPPDTLVEGKITYYLPRIDSFFVNSEGLITDVTGVSSLNPSPPPNNSVNNAIKIADVFLTPYVFDKKEISIKRYEYPNYTKNDIKKLENRIDNLEEFVTLSLLEKDAAALSIVDNNGFERTKTGLVVENFNTRNRTFLGDMAHPSYKCATGENILKCRERRIPLDLFYTNLDSHNIHLHEDGVLSMSYNEEEFINQPLSSFSMSVNPFGVSIYKGKIDLNLAKDNWVETRQVAAISTGQGRFIQENSENFIPDKNNLAKNLREGNNLRMRIRAGIFGWIIINRLFRDNVRANSWYVRRIDGQWIRGITTAGIGRAFLEKYGSTRTLSDAQITSWLDNEVNGGEVTSRTFTRRTADRTTITTRTIRETAVRRIDATINEENTEVVGREVLDRGQTRSEIPFIRSKPINFKANGLKPNTQFYPFFDNEFVGEHCIPITKGYKIINVSAYNTADKEYVITLENPAPFGIAGDDESDWQEVSIIDLNNVDDLTDEELTEDNLKTNKAEDFKYKEKISARKYRIHSPTSNIFLEGAENFAIMWNPKRGEEIFSDDKGDVSGQFVIPTAKYRTENRVFSLSEDKDDPAPTSHKISSASNLYAARGTLIVNRSLTQNVVRPTIKLSETLSNKNSKVLSKASIRRPFVADPVAQTFFVDDTLLGDSTNKIGVYISSVDIFFSKREEVLNEAVILELVTVDNGYPTQNVIASVQSPSKEEDADFVKLSDDATVPTKFSFESPVFLQNGEEYAIVIKSNSNNYHAFVANVGDNDVTTGKLIKGQPHLGVFFTSQNSSTWTADQNKDLKFRINRCKFITSDSGSSFGLYFPPLSLFDGAILEYRGNDKSDGDKIFLLHANNHGFDDGDKHQTIKFFYPTDADNEFGGFIGTITEEGDGYEGDFEIEAIVDKNKLLVSLNTALSLTENTSISPIAIENRLKFDEAQFNIDATIPPNINIETKYRLDDAGTIDNVIIGENRVFNEEKALDDFSDGNPRINEKIVTTIKSDGDDFLSPMFSTNSATFIIMKNLIDEYKKEAKVFEVDGTTITGIDDFIESTDGKNDSNDAVYVTKKLLLEVSSNRLKLLFDSVEEEGADIKIFYKTQESDSGDFDDISWTLLNTEEYNELNHKRVSSSAEDFIEREFEVATPNNFSAYALKFVMTTDNKPPIIKRLRIIAVAD